MNDMFLICINKKAFRMKGFFTY